MSPPSPKRRRLSGEFTPVHLHTSPGGNAPEPVMAVSQPPDSGSEPLYKLCAQPPARAYPHPSQDLIQLFHLTDIADSVRRVDPRTGEKINKIRKSYEGKVKELRLAGRNKAVAAPGQWIPNLLLIPDDDWHATRVLGKEIEKGRDNAGFAAKLARAMQGLAPGKLPDREAEHWRNILATDEPVARPLQQLPAHHLPPNKLAAVAGGLAAHAGAAAAAVSSAAAAGAAGQKQAAAVGVVAAATAGAAGAAAKAVRPERTGTKRSYKDASFVGYGEGFVDDDETDEDGRPLASLRRKRRKEDFGGVPNSTVVWAS